MCVSTMEPPQSLFWAYAWRGLLSAFYQLASLSIWCDSGPDSAAERYWNKVDGVAEIKRVKSSEQAPVEEV